jgi:3-hydroxyisobutyrate dehydrogenase
MTGTTPRVGFIGLGDQGAPMAQRIIAAGYPTTLWARRVASLTPFASTAAQTAPSPRALGTMSDVVGICVVADDDVVEVVAGPDGVLAGMQPGSVIMVHSTTHPDTCRRLAQRAADRGVSLVDAPVSGGGQRASQGALLLMIGGEPDVIERCRPVVDTFANPVIHVGPVGSGQIAKLLNNLLFTAHLALGTRTFDLAARLGLPSRELARVLEQGSGGSFAIAVLAATGYTAAGATARAGPLLRKDTELVVELSRSVDASIDVLRDVADDALDIMGQRRDAAR